jgi:hypothetical protein
MRQRAKAAEWLARHADHGAEVHQRLVVVARAPRRQVRCCQLPEFSLTRGAVGEFSEVEDTREDAASVCVESRLIPPKAYGGDGSCSVASDAGQAAQQFDITRQHSTILLLDDQGGSVQVAGATIIAEAFPS